MNKIFPSGPMLELDHVQCCNRAVDDSSSSSSDDGVVYSGKLNAVIRNVLNTWPLNSDVQVHVRQTSKGIIEPL